MPDHALSEAELYIMRQFWAYGPMKTDELGRLVAARNWRPTTLLTFLSRLCQKGVLALEKQGRGNLYRPLLQKGEYERREGRAFLDGLFEGSAANFLAAMVDANALDEAELAELHRWLKEQEGEDG
ncbi:BlaI/MecI/CopY family transcriptional regulator [Ruminococcaceae bacterium OttesenSCG-928-O06]|nr:BlaI/MecI/CopY family transcriptional regulator [Ruminococcaceae bacterium OttesenSCG-928-O06]